MNSEILSGYSETALGYVPLMYKYIMSHVNMLLNKLRLGLCLNINICHAASILMYQWISILFAGNTTLDEMMSQLLGAHETFREQLQAEIQEEDERDEREQVKQEQDDAYQQSLAADRVKVFIIIC